MVEFCTRKEIVLTFWCVDYQSCVIHTFSYSMKIILFCNLLFLFHNTLASIF